MDSFLETLSNINGEVNSFIWGPWLLIPLLLGVGLYLTIRLKLVQIFKLGPALMLGLIRRKDKGADTEGDITQFQALTTALAATVGVGNIVGVAGAILIGGPGALFWMWVTGILGMATKYTEAFLAVRFRTTDANGQKSGGPQYYLQKGIKNGFGKFLAISFAIFAFLASFGIGNMTQSNAIAVNVESSFGIPLWITGLILAVLTAAVIIGGIKSIGRVTSALVPVMIVFYIVAALYILIANVGAIPAAFGEVFSQAFTGTAAVGGFIGSTFLIAMQLGVARGLFSNESGLGSAPIAAAAAKTTHPVRQGLVSMTQTFIDTIVVVTFTGLVLITSGVWKEEGVEKGTATGDAFAQQLPGDWGHILVTVALILFAFSTIIGWSYYGERNVERLFGVRGIMPYRLVFSAVVFVGAISQLEEVWTLADSLNGLMAIPNLIGLVILSGLVARETSLYLKNDPKLTANKAEIDRFMAEDPGYQEWKKLEKEQHFR